MATVGTKELNFHSFPGEKLNGNDWMAHQDAVLSKTASHQYVEMQASGWMLLQGLVVIRELDKSRHISMKPLFKSKVFNTLISE